MSINPNTVKSQDGSDNDELGRTMTLLRAIEQLEKTECELERAEHKAERLQKQLDIAVNCMQDYIRSGCYPYMEKKLAEIKELIND